MLRKQWRDRLKPLVPRNAHLLHSQGAAHLRLNYDESHSEKILAALCLPESIKVSNLQMLEAVPPPPPQDRSSQDPEAVIRIKSGRQLAAAILWVEMQWSLHI